MLHHTYEANLEGKDYIVGDLHGCYHDFKVLLQEIGFNEKVDRMFSVGDLIDRGPDSYKCLQLMYEPWFIPVYGNHEDLMVDTFKGGDSGVWLANGGTWIFDYIDEPLMSDYVQDLTSLPVFITLEHKSGRRVGICHAEAPTMDWNDISLGLSKYELQKAIWGRTRVHYGSEPIANIDYTFHGHTIVPEVTKVANSIYIDTGSFLVLDKFQGDGYITIIDLDDFLGE